MSDIQDPRWILLKPSLTNLILTLGAALLACASLWLIDIDEWVRAVILLAALILLVFDIYLIRFKSSDAIDAFYLFEREAAPILPKPTPAADHLPAAAEKSVELVLRIHFANPGKRTRMLDIYRSEAEVVVTRSPYVSTYFTSIPYRFPNDPAWRRWFPRVLALWADSLDRERFRQVRIRLKWR